MKGKVSWAPRKNRVGCGLRLITTLVLSLPTSLVAGQGVPGLTVGEWKQTQAPKIDRDVLDLIETRQIPVYVVAEDLAERGIERSELVPGVLLLSRTALPGLFAAYTLVAHW